LVKAVLIGSKHNDNYNISTHIALKNHQNICKGIRVTEVLPVLSSSAWVKRIMPTL